MSFNVGTKLSNKKIVFRKFRRNRTTNMNKSVYLDQSNPVRQQDSNV